MSIPYRTLGRSPLKVSALCLGTVMFGKLLAGQRERVVLATKLGNAMGDGPNQAGYSCGWVLGEIDASLARLRTGHIDILHLYPDDSGTDLKEPPRARDAMLRAGKIRYGDVSNFRGWRVARMVRVADEDEALVDSLVAPGHPSTPGYNDPAYPLNGRVRAASGTP